MGEASSNWIKQVRVMEEMEIWRLWEEGKSRCPFCINLGDEDWQAICDCGMASELGGTELSDLCTDLRVARERLCRAQWGVGQTYKQTLQEALDALDRVAIYHCPHWSDHDVPEPPEPAQREFTFRLEEDGTLSLDSAVYQALGAASMCWAPTPIGVFEAGRAKMIGQKLLEVIQNTEQ